MADASYSINIDGKQAVTTINSLEKKVQELSASLKDCAVGSKEFADTQKELREYQTVLEGINQTSVNLGDNIVKVAQGIVGGFQVAQGALALFGTESEAVQKSIEKMAALMSLTQGIKSLTEGAKAFKLLTTAVSASSKGLGTFKKALIGTGLGAIVVVLGSIIANWEEFTKAIGVSQESLDKLGQVFSGVMNVIKESTASIARAFAKVFKGDFSGALDELKSGFDFKATYAAGVEAKITEQQQEESDKRKEARDKANEDYRKELDRQAAKVKATIEDEKKQQEELIKIEQKRLKTFAEGSKEYYEQLLKIKELQKSDKETATTEETKPDFSQIDADMQKIGQIQQRLEENSRTAEENEIQRLTDKYQTELALLEQYGVDTTTLTEQYESQKASIEAKYANERKKQESEVTAFKKQQTQQQIQLGLQAANNMASVLGSIAGMIDTTTEDGFEKAKKLQIAEATINMITGIVAALSGTFTTHTGIWDIAIAATQAASIAAAGIANISKIKNTKFESASTSSTANISSTATPSSSAVNSTLIAPTQYSQEVSNARLEEKVGDTRVYVTEGDIQRTTKKVSVAESESRY